MTSSSPSTDDAITELVVTQQVPAPVDQVWAAWTSAEGWARWWWPHWEDTEYEVDAREGGRYLARSAEGGAGVAGEFSTVEPPHLLEMTWRWDGEPGEDTVRVELTEQELDGLAGTLVTVRHRTAAGGVDDYRQGWEFVLGNLAASQPAPRGSLADRISNLQGPSLRLEQLVPAAADEVFDSWIDPERLRTWWWPEHPDTTFEIDPRVGGTFRFRSESYGFGAHGSYLAIDRPDFLAMTWEWESGPASSTPDVVTVELTDLGDRTLVELTHHMAEPTDDTTNAERGWSEVLHNLG